MNSNYDCVHTTPLFRLANVYNLAYVFTAHAHTEWTSLTERKSAHLLPCANGFKSAVNLQYGKMGNQNVQLVLQYCGEKSWKVMLRVFPPTFKPFLQQISLLQVTWRLTSVWMKLLGSHAIHGSYVTCWKTSLSWASKTRNMYRFFCKKKKTTLYFLQQPVCCKRSWFVGGKTCKATI